MPAFRLLAHTLTSAVGSGCHAHAQALAERRSGLRANDFTLQPLTTWIGRVAGLEDSPLPARWAAWDCRNNRLAWQALQHDGLLDALLQLRGRWPAHRLGIAVGTSTGSIAETETGYRELQADGRFPERLRQPALHSPHSLGDFLQAALDWQGPCLTLSTACSSSAKAYATAARWLQQGVCDAVLVGGCDSLCQSTLHGFASLQLTSPGPCRPMDERRDGISIGEAAAFAILVPAAADDGPDNLYLAGWGESADAHHMSAPHPEGAGARLAIEAALARAGRRPEDIGYINLHGTASRLNDQIEAALVAQLFPQVPASSTKGWTGHTLGAAGALEAGLALIAMEHGLLPGTLNCEQPDPACGPGIATGNIARRVDAVLSNSFGFGGSNASLVFSRGAPDRHLPAPDGTGANEGGTAPAAVADSADTAAATPTTATRATSPAPASAPPLARLSVHGIGLWAPGIDSWQQARAMLSGQLPDAEAWPLAGGRRPAPDLIPANERRRAPATVLLAVSAAAEACRQAGIDPAGIASVFASRYGDLEIIDYMCRTLAEDAAAMSPTRFHNSVHNAASGYWSIATGAQGPTTATAAGAATFAHGLLEAASQVCESRRPVLLVAYDLAGTGPVGELVDSTAPFACALVLGWGTPDPDPGGTGANAPLARLEVAVAPRCGNPVPDGSAAGEPEGNDSDPLPRHPGLRALATANPVARSAAALLEHLATGGVAGAAADEAADNRPPALRLRLNPALDLRLQWR